MADTDRPTGRDLIYMRHSTDHQTDQRQRHALRDLIDAGAPVYDDPATSSRVPSLERSGFRRLLDDAAVGDSIHIADAARLFRSVADVLEMRPVLIRRGIHLRVRSGLLSGIDLAADDPGTKMVVSVLAAVLEFQRDMIAENTREGVAAARAEGRTAGPAPSLDTSTSAAVVTAYRQGRAVRQLARDHDVSPRTIQRALDAAGVRVTVPPPASQDIWTIRIPGVLADLLAEHEDQEVRDVISAGRRVRHGGGHTLTVTARPDVHRYALDWLTRSLDTPGVELSPTVQGATVRRAVRQYAARITQADRPA